MLMLEHWSAGYRGLARTDRGIVFFRMEPPHGQEQVDHAASE